MSLILQRELQDCHGQYMEVILKNAGTLLALWSCRQSPRDGRANEGAKRISVSECERRIFLVRTLD